MAKLLFVIKQSVLDSAKFKMFITFLCSDTAPRCSFNISVGYKIGFQNILYRSLIFTQRCTYGTEPHRFILGRNKQL